MTMLVKIEWLTEKMNDTLSRLPIDQRKVVIDVLIWADVTGKNTQGVIKLTGTEPLQDVIPRGEIQTSSKKCSNLIQGNGHPAPFTANIGLSMAIDSAHTHGIGISGVNGIFSSTSAQSYYTYQAAKQDLICMVMSRSPAVQTGFGSIDPLFGTNPVSMAFPSEGEPLFFDYTTSACTWYALIMAQIRGDRLPDFYAIDKDGNFTPDPNRAMEGSLLPHGRDSLSSSLALMVELLAGPLVGASFCDPAINHEWGTFILVIDPDLLAGKQVFKRSVSELVEKVKGSRTGWGEQIRLPGEVSLKRREQAERTGMVEIDDKLLKHLGYI